MTELKCGDYEQRGTRGRLWWKEPKRYRVRCKIESEWIEGLVCECSRGCGKTFMAVSVPWEGDVDWGASDRGWYETGMSQEWHLVGETNV